MEKHLSLLRTVGIFQGFNDDEISLMIKCLSPSFVSYAKDEVIMLQGGELTRTGIIVAGRAKIQKEDINGDSVTIDELAPGDMFGDGFISPDAFKMPVSIWSISQTTAAFINSSRIMSLCPSECAFHRRLITNIVEAMSKRLASLNQKIYILQNSTIRRKLLAFLEFQREKFNSDSFTISLSRNELAEYIGVNRSAMSRELYNMLDDGIIFFEGNTFQMRPQQDIK